MGWRSERSLPAACVAVFVGATCSSLVLQVTASTFHATADIQGSGGGRRLHLRGFENISSKGNASAGAWRPPRIYFLFLAVDKISNLGLWNEFFKSAPKNQYRAFVHCKLPSCISQVAGSVLSPVQTVPSYYCTDLVSPMNQLLSYALYDDPSSANMADKFAFVSDSTLPAKPFSHIYSTLSSRTGSDFCIFPPNEWADVPGTIGLELAAKHHQWITLERGHAEKALALWQSGTLHNFMQHFRMNYDQYAGNNNSFADHRNFGCLDEFWHMAALYGPIGHASGPQEQMVQLSRFTGGPLKVSKNAGWQGECDTFVQWAKYLHSPGRNPFEQFHAALDAVSKPHDGNMARPGWWDAISSDGILAVRASSFLFVRKFVDGPRLADGGDFVEAYSRLALSS